MAAHLAQIGAMPTGGYFAGDPRAALRLAQADAAAASISQPRRTVADLLADPLRWHLPEPREPPAHLRWPEIIEFRQDPATTLAQMAAILAQSNVTSISDILPLVVTYAQSIHLAPDHGWSSAEGGRGVCLRHRRGGRGSSLGRRRVSLSL